MDRALVAREKMPAAGRTASRVLADVVVLFGARQSGCVSGIETHGEHVKFLTDSERERAQGSNEAIEQHRAEIAALEVDEIEYNRFAVEIIRETNLSTCFIAEPEI